MRNKTLLWGSFAALLAFVPNAGATLQLTLSSGGTTVVVNDGGAGDVNPAPGQVTFVGAVGNWILNVSTGTALGSTAPIIDLNSVNTINGNGTGANTLTVQFSATNQAGPLPAGGFASKIGGTLGSGTSITYQGYIDPGNALNGLTNAIGALQSFGPGSISFSGNVVGGPAVGALYSATEVVVLSGTGTFVTSSFDAAIDAVPEPAGALLLGGVLLFTAGAIRRKVSSKRA